MVPRHGVVIDTSHSSHPAKRFLSSIDHSNLMGALMSRPRRDRLLALGIVMSCESSVVVDCGTVDVDVVVEVIVADVSAAGSSARIVSLTGSSSVSG